MDLPKQWLIDSVLDLDSRSLARYVLVRSEPELNQDEEQLLRIKLCEELVFGL